MAEPFELIDDWELILYLISIEQLERQQAALLSGEMFNIGFWERESAIMTAAFAPAIEDIMMRGVFFSTPEEHLDKVASLFENQRIYAEQHAGKLVKNVNGVTDEKVQEIINRLTQQSIEEGWDIDTFTENILSEAEGWFSEMRARRIAVTETTDAFMGGAELSKTELQGQGVNIVARWLTANDDLVCAICAPRHLKLQGDGWTDMSPAHVGCRCDIALEEVLI